MHANQPADRCRAQRGLTDAGAIALAVSAAAGAWWSGPVPLAVALLVVVLALGIRRPLLLVIGVALLAAALGARAWAGLEPPAQASFSGLVTLVGDPTTASFGAVRADVDAGGRRVQLTATGQAADVVARLLSGERIQVVGRLGPPPPALADQLARRHVAGRLTVDSVGVVMRGSAVHALANGLRRTLADGATPLGNDRPLFLGMVFGDDRGQSVVVADDFKAAGLTHLLAVSGQNVAFVLILASPLLSRLGLRSRWVATLAFIGFFALVTRFEPSVLRASAMAAIACTASGLGRPAPRARILALAVTAVLLVDPLLVRSLSFLLSVGASAGIIVLARPFAARVRGPRWLADVVGVTAAAQVGVAPVLLPIFGGIPLASLPANVLAVPASGPLMVWGLTGGTMAGVLGPPFDGWLHLPSSWLVGWVAAVARWGAGLPLGTLRIGHAVALVVLGGGLALLGRGAPRWVVPIGAAAVAAVLLAPVVALPSDLVGVDGGSGAALWRSGGAVVVVLDDPWVPGVLAELRDEGVRHIDVLVIRRGGRLVAGSVLELRSRVPVRRVLAPTGHRVRGAIVPAVGRTQVGGLVVDVGATEGSLEVTVVRAGAGRRT